MVQVKVLFFYVYLFQTVISFNFMDRMTIQIKSLHCEHVNPKIYNGSVKCSIKPTRNGQGITNVRYTYGKPCNDLWVHFKTFYRFPTGIKYQPWMGEFDVDVCNTIGSNLLSVPVYFLSRSMRKFAPGLIHKCPYFGEEGLKDGNADAIMGNALPQIIPKGYYKLLLRFHLANNDTFLNVWLIAKLDAQDPMKAYEM